MNSNDLVNLRVDHAQLLELMVNDIASYWIPKKSGAREPTSAAVVRHRSHSGSRCDGSREFPSTTHGDDLPFMQQVGRSVGR